jgi:hypothetical protein
MSNTTNAALNVFARVDSMLEDVQHRREVAVKVSKEADTMNRVAHAANVEYGKFLCAWAHDIEPNVRFFELTMDELRKAAPAIHAEAKAFRDSYVSSNISVIWKRIRETARKYAEVNGLYGLSPNMLGEEGTDGADGEVVGTGSAGGIFRSAREVIESDEKNGGVWLFRNLDRRESLTMSEAEFKAGLFDLLLEFGLSEEQIRG